MSLPAAVPPHFNSRTWEWSLASQLPSSAAGFKQVGGAVFFGCTLSYAGFPDSSVGKESACNARDPGSIPGLGRSTGKGIGYPLQDSWTFPVAQLVKNPPAMWETWVQSLGWKDPLEKGKATHSSSLVWRIPWTV